MTEPASARVPNLVIAGVLKSGTTSLFNYLAQHHDICPSDVKETRFFDPLRFGEPLEPVSRYADHVRHWKAERYAIEATPGYLYGGQRLARSMHEISPDVRVLLSLRSPSDRCWSSFRFVKSRARVPKAMTFEDYLDRCFELNRQGIDSRRENLTYWSLGSGCYARWLEAWHSEYGDRLKIVYFDDVKNDPVGVLKGICGWLDLDTHVVDSFDLAVENKTEQYRNAQAQRLALAVNRRAERFFREHRTTKRALRGMYYQVNRETSRLTVSAAAAATMADFYKPWDVLLAQQLQAMRVPPPPWGKEGRARAQPDRTPVIG